MSKLTIGDLIKKHGNSNRPATHFFHVGAQKDLPSPHEAAR
jgi:hypothetical protein